MASDSKKRKRTDTSADSHHEQPDALLKGSRDAPTPAVAPDSKEVLFFGDPEGDRSLHPRSEYRHLKNAAAIPQVGIPVTPEQDPSHSRLLFPVIESRTIRPQVRTAARRKKLQDTAMPHSSEPTHNNSTTTYTADPGKLPASKKAKYYGVREGRKPGIYYDWNETSKQTQGCRSIYASFKSIAEVEAFMNHLPKDCRWSACAKACKIAAESQQTTDAAGSKHTAGDEEDPAPAASQCDCCSISVSGSTALCDECFSDPTLWVDAVIKNQGLALEQASVLRTVAEGRNVFFIGAAGTGKSRLIAAIREYLRGLEAGVAIIAPTGVAAINVEGQTLHTYAGWDGNVSRVNLEELCERAHQKKVWKRFTDTDVLIIDEISMIESNNLTRLSQSLQAAASTKPGGNERRPFGGVQVVISGDFFQLAPVKPFSHCMTCGQEMEKLQGGQRRCAEHGECSLDDKFAFASKIWPSCELESVALKHIHRQVDPAFISILTSLRKSRYLTSAEEDTLLNHTTTIKRDAATKLLPRRDDANKINDSHLSQITNPTVEMTATDNFQWQQELHPELYDLTVRCGDQSTQLRALHDHRSRYDLELKLGMLVLLTANINPMKGLVNGSIGHIVGWVEMRDENMPRASSKKAGKEAEKFAGQVIWGDHSRYKQDQITRFRQALPEFSRKWPVVEFKDGVKQVVFASCLVSEMGRHKPYSLLSRTQIPLLPGWAITIHKSQGMTLDSVVVDLAKCWEPGQAYVALSRARSLEGLIVDTLPTKVTADPVVEQFMAETFGEDENELGGQVGEGGAVSAVHAAV